MSRLTYTDQELHQIGMNHVGNLLKEMGYEFLGVNSSLNKNPQFVGYKKSEKLLFVIVKTVLYPDNPNEKDLKLIEKMKVHAKKNEANLCYAGVGLAHAYDVNERLTKDDDFLVKFDGFMSI